MQAQACLPPVSLAGDFSDSCLGHPSGLMDVALSWGVEDVGFSPANKITGQQQGDLEQIPLPPTFI